MSLPMKPNSQQDRGGSGVSGRTEGGLEVLMLHKHLICPFCQEVFNKPVVILPCQHNLCRKCATQLYQPSLFQACKTLTDNSRHFHCPSCRQEVVLDCHGVYGLQRNLLVERIIDIYNQELSNNIRCSTHSTEKVNIYCITCGLLTCSLCKVFGAHQSCRVVPLTHICQQKKEELNDHVESLIALNHKILSVIKQLEDACTSIQERSELQKQRVCDKVQQVFLILEGKQKVMMQQLTREQEEKTNHIQGLMCCFQNSMKANKKLLEKAALSIEKDDLVTFIQSSRELISNVTEASQCFPPESLEADPDSLTDYRYNFRRQERALRSINFRREHVPKEEKLQYFEEPCIQNIQAKHHRDSDIESFPEVICPNHHCLDSAVEADAVISPPEKPSISNKEAAAADLLINPVEPSRMVLTFSEDEPEGNKEEMQGEPPPDLLHEENISEQQEGLSTQQMVILIFYLITLLLVLKRVWFYIDCLICT